MSSISLCSRLCGNRCSVPILGPDFVTEGRSLILYGRTGRGKTHLAVAIDYRAIQNGFETLCTTAAELIEDLSNASAKGLLQQSLSTYTRPHVLVIDEIGYLSYGPDAANVLFHVVNDRHLRKRPMIFTTNKPLRWTRERCCTTRTWQLPSSIESWNVDALYPLDGPSGRTRHLNLGEVSPSKAERLRISGTHSCSVAYLNNVLSVLTRNQVVNLRALELLERQKTFEFIKRFMKRGPMT